MSTSQDQVIIVGGGIASLACAWELASHGFRVKLLDGGQPRASDYSAGILLPTEPHRTQGELGKLNRRAFKLWPEWADWTQEKSYLSNGIIQTLDHTSNPHETQGLEHGLADWDLPITRINPMQIKEKHPYYQPGGYGSEAIWLAQAACVDPRAHMQNLRGQLPGLGVEIIAGYHLEKVLFRKDQVVGLRFSGAETMMAERVVLACGLGPYDFLPLEHRPRLEAASGHRALLQPGEDWRAMPILEAQGTTLVPRTGGTVWAGVTFHPGSADHSLILADTHWILNAALAAAPSLSRAHILELGVGIRSLSRDGIPYAGPTQIQGLYMLTGHGRDGVLQAPLSAKLIRQLIQGQVLPGWAKVLDPRGRCG